MEDMVDHPEIYFENIKLDPEAYYFLFVGELKAHGLNEFVKQSLRKKLRRKIGFVSVIPDTLDRYSPFRNMIVVNPEAKRLCLEAGCVVSQRISMSLFAQEVSRSPYVRQVIQDILARQPELYLWMFESKPELTLTDIPGVKLLGPEAVLTVQLNNKVWQYDTFQGQIPVVEHDVVVGRDELLKATARLRREWRDGIFVTSMYSAAGMGSMVTRSQRDVELHFQDTRAQYLISRYVEHEHDPTVLGCVANEHDVFIAGVADQIIEGGNQFRGSTYPSVLPKYLQENLCDYTRIVGRTLGRLGFRGIFGCDYIVDDTECIYFVEVNTRKQGTTMEFCCSLERLLPCGAPNLLELEHHSVLYGEFPANTVHLDHSGTETPNGVHWGTYNYKVSLETFTRRPLKQRFTERGLFKRVAERGKAGYIILEHVGAPTRVRAGAFMGRVVAVGPTRRDMLGKLEQGKGMLARSILQTTEEARAERTAEHHKEMGE